MLCILYVISKLQCSSRYISGGTNIIEIKSLLSGGFLSFILIIFLFDIHQWHTTSSRIKFASDIGFREYRPLAKTSYKRNSYTYKYRPPFNGEEINRSLFCEFFFDLNTHIIKF